MDSLNVFLNFLAKTEGRDKALGLIQYLTLIPAHRKQASTVKNIYTQLGTTRKILRFLKTLEYSTAIRKDIP